MPTKIPTLPGWIRPVLLTVCVFPSFASPRRRTKAGSAPSKISLFSLPWEIQMMIWEYVLEPDVIFEFRTKESLPKYLEVAKSRWHRDRPTESSATSLEDKCPAVSNPISTLSSLGHNITEDDVKTLLTQDKEWSDLEVDFLKRRRATLSLNPVTFSFTPILAQYLLVSKTFSEYVREADKTICRKMASIVGKSIQKAYTADAVLNPSRPTCPQSVRVFSRSRAIFSGPPPDVIATLRLIPSWFEELVTHFHLTATTMSIANEAEPGDTFGAYIHDHGNHTAMKPSLLATVLSRNSHMRRLRISIDGRQEWRRSLAILDGTMLVRSNKIETLELVHRPADSEKADEVRFEDIVPATIIDFLKRGRYATRRMQDDEFITRGVYKNLKTGELEERLGWEISIDNSPPRFYEV